MTSTGQDSAASFIQCSLAPTSASSLTIASSGISNTAGHTLSHNPQEVQPTSIHTYFKGIIISMSIVTQSDNHTTNLLSTAFPSMILVESDCIVSDLTML